MGQAVGAWRAIVILFLLVGVSRAADETGFVNRVYRDDAGEHKYVVFVPENYRADAKWPVILFLHGAGERGTDGQAPLTVGLGPLLKERAKSFPFVAVFPQCEDVQGRLLTGWSADSADGKRALAILSAVEKDYSIDPKRRILTGWSMGGYGAWSLAAAHPEMFSAVVPVSGGGDAAWGAKLAKLSVWAMHGAKDAAVPASESRKMVDAIKGAGGQPRYTEFPDAEHDVWKLVYGSDALYAWMLNPKSGAPSDAALVARPGQRPPRAAEADAPFVPAVEMPRAVYVRLGNDMLRALAHAVPTVVPRDVLRGRINDIHDYTTAEGRTFSVALTGISYSGQLTRAHVQAYRKDRLNIQLGLQNVVLQIGASYVQGAGRSASAGPMHVVIGHRAPVWLSLDVTPYVDGRELRLRLVATRFSIPDDNWYVTAPAGVSTSGLGMTSERVSSGLVSGIYGKKYRIESEVVAVVPSLMSRLEEQLKVDQVNGIVGGFWPLPVYQPRVRAWPEAVETDEQGVSLLMGVTAAAVNPQKAPRAPQVVQPLGPPLEVLPRHKRLEVGVAPNLLGPLTDLLVRADVARIHVLDIPEKKFAAFADRQALTAAIPDLKRFGDSLEIWSELVLVEPLSVVDTPQSSSVAQAEPVRITPAANGNGAQAAASENDELATAADEKPANAADEKEANAADEKPAESAEEKDKKSEGADEKSPAAEPARRFMFRAPRVLISLAVRTDPQAEWKPYAEFSFDVSQQAAASVVRPNYDERGLQIEWSGDPQVEASGRFAPGYAPEQVDLDVDKARAMFVDAWTAWTHGGPAAQATIPDIDFGYSKLRLEQATWAAPFLYVGFGEPGVKLSNLSEEPLVYETKGPYSGWGGPFTLKAGKSSEFDIDYPLLFRRQVNGQYEMFTLPVGSHSEFRPPTGGGKPQLFKAKRKPAASDPAKKGA